MRAGAAWGQAVGNSMLFIGRVRAPVRLPAAGVLHLGLEQELFAWDPAHGPPSPGHRRGWSGDRVRPVGGWPHRDLPPGRQADPRHRAARPPARSEPAPAGPADDVPGACRCPSPATCSSSGCSPCPAATPGWNWWTTRAGASGDFSSGATSWNRWTPPPPGPPPSSPGPPRWRWTGGGPPAPPRSSSRWVDAASRRNETRRPGKPPGVRIRPPTGPPFDLPNTFGTALRGLPFP